MIGGLYWKCLLLQESFPLVSLYIIIFIYQLKILQGDDYYYCDELSSCSSLVKSDYKVTDLNRTFLKTIA